MTDSLFKVRPYVIGLIILMIISMDSYTVSAKDEKPVTNNVSSVTAAEDSESESLKSTLSALSSSVPESGLNGDYLPGMTTVLYGKDLAERGVVTVGEALTHVPGITVSMNPGGGFLTIVRGLPKPFASGQIKFLLNGEPMDTVLGIDLIPNIPIEQVLRIEMVRGPSSVRYGESAYAGVVNIITNKNKNLIYGGAGEYDSYLAGAVFSKSCPEKDFNASLNMAYQSTRRGDLVPEKTYANVTSTSTGGNHGDGNDGGVTISGDNIITQGITHILDPDRSVNTKSLLSTLFSVEYKGFNLEAHHLENGQGNFYSTIQEGLSIKKAIRLSPDVNSTFSLGWMGQSTDEDYSDYHNNDILHPVYGARYNSTTYQGNTDISVNSIENHTFLLDLFAKKSEPIHLERKTDTGPDTFDWPGSQLISLMIQDTWKATDRLSLTASARNDWYENLGNEISPQLAAVYRLNPSRSGAITHLIKIQVARAVRPQSFLDITDISSQNLTMKTPGFETVDSIEGGYIFRSPGTTSRMTAFTSKIKTGPSVYLSDGKDHRYTSYGTEAELEQDIYRDILKLDLNASWIHVKDQDTYETPPGSAGYLANAGLICQVHPRLSMTIQYQFIGDRSGDPVHSADITAVCKPIYKNFTIRGGVKNLFNSDVMYPSHLDQDRLMYDGYVFYPGSYQKVERWWWLRAEYGF